MSAKFKVVPIRRREGVWTMTTDHAAQARAIAWFKPGERVKFVLRRPTKAEAEKFLVATQRAAEGPINRYSLGKRMSRS